MAALAGVAFAEVSVVSSYENISSGGVELNALVVELDAEHASGLHYNVDTMAGSVAGVGLNQTEMTLGYDFAGIGGPVIAYGYRDIAGQSEDIVMAGFSGKHNIGENFKIAGEVISDIDNFGDTNRVTLGADYKATDVISIFGEFEHLDSDGIQNKLEIGANYALSESVFVQGALANYKSEGVSATGASVGFGFKF